MTFASKLREAVFTDLDSLLDAFIDTKQRVLASDPVEVGAIGIIVLLADDVEMVFDSATSYEFAALLVFQTFGHHNFI